MKIRVWLKIEDKTIEEFMDIPPRYNEWTWEEQENFLLLSQVCLAERYLNGELGVDFIDDVEGDREQV